MFEVGIFRVMRTAACGAGLMAVAVSPAAAQMEWLGTQGQSWFLGNNWNPVGPPSSTDDVVIDTVSPHPTVIGIADADARGLSVGNTATGELTIENGHTLTTGANGSIGHQAGSTGAVTVTGIDSTWDLDGHTLSVGLGGDGVLVIEEGGGVEGGFVGIGNQAGSQGHAWVSGTGSTLNHTANLVVGEGGTGELDVSNGGQVTSGSFGFIREGDVTVSGLNSAWQLAGGLRVGGTSAGTGTLTIAEQALVENTEGSIGHFANTQGAVTVDGVGSIWDNSTQLIVGNEGAGSLSITGGASVTNNFAALIGVEEDSVGVAIVSGTDSTWTSSAFMLVGGRGLAGLTIDAGGEVTGSNGVIGLYSPSVGTVAVTGSGSSWTLSGSLIVADQSGAGTLTVDNGGTVDTGTWSIIGNSDQTEGAVSITDPGSAWSIGEDLTVGNHNLSSAHLTIGAGAGVHVSGAVTVADVANPGGCDCQVRVDGLLVAAHGTQVNADSRLLGAGSIGGGTTTIAGTVAPGTSPGTLSTRDLAFLPTAVLEFELDGPGGNGDQILVQGALTLDGTLNVSNLGGLDTGSYVLIEYTGTLTDNGLSIGSLPPAFAATVDTSVAGEVRLEVEALPDALFSDRFEQ